MALTLEDINKIAHLARLGLSDDEKNRYTDSLNNILGLIDELQAVNTTGIEPLAHSLDVTQPLRPDVVAKKISVKLISKSRLLPKMACI